MAIVLNSAKFTLIPTSDVNNQIIKYSDDYINKVLNAMKTKHAQEVKENYYFKQALTIKDYQTMIKECEEKEYPQEKVDEFDNKLTQLKTEHENLMNELRQVDNKELQSLENEIEKIGDSIYNKSLKINNSVLDGASSFDELDKIQAKIDNLTDKRENLYNQLNKKYGIINDLKDKLTINEHNQRKIQHDKEQYILSFKCSIQKQIEGIKEDMKKEKQFHLALQNKEMKLKQYHLSKQIIIDEIYEKFSKKLIPQIDNYYYELYTSSTLSLLHKLVDKYNVDLGENVKKYLEDNKDYFEPAEEDDDEDEEEDFTPQTINWLDSFTKCLCVLKSQAEQAQPKPEPEQKQTEPVIEEVEEIVISKSEPIKPIQKQTTTEKTFQGFVQTLPNDEIRGEDLVKAYNEYFGTNTTAKSLCQKKEFKQYFTKSPKTHVENRKRVPYYIKQ